MEEPEKNRVHDELPLAAFTICHLDHFTVQKWIEIFQSIAAKHPDAAIDLTGRVRFTREEDEVIEE